MSEDINKAVGQELAPYEGAHSAIMPTNFRDALDLARELAKSDMIPDHLKGKPGNCLFVIDQAQRWRMSPLAVAQATSFIHGKAMYEGKLVAAAVNTSGALRVKLNYQTSGEFHLGRDSRGNTVPDFTKTTLSVTVTGTMIGEEAPRAVTVTWRQAFNPRNAEPWLKAPEQMLCYFGARVWARRHLPAVILGVDVREDWPAREAAAAETPPGPEGAKDVTPTSVLDAFASSAPSPVPSSSPASSPPPAASSDPSSTPAAEPKRRGRPPKAKAEAPPHDPETGEIAEEPATLGEILDALPMTHSPESSASQAPAEAAGGSQTGTAPAGDLSAEELREKCLAFGGVFMEKLNRCETVADLERVIAANWTVERRKLYAAWSLDKYDDMNAYIDQRREELGGS